MPLKKEVWSLSDNPSFLEAIEQLNDATIDLRKTAHNLLPEIVLQQGLADACAHFCTKMAKSTGVAIDFHLSGNLSRLDAAFELSIYRIVQELIQNIIKHSKATQALVQLNCHEPLLIVTVEDNGTGFDKNLQSNNGIGISNIVDRVNALKGHIKMESNKDIGTSIYLEFDITLLKNFSSNEYQDSHYG